MILVADSGSTKTDWAVLDQHGDVVDTFITRGFSPNSVSTLFIVDELKRSPQFLKAIAHIHRIYFYGTGCSSPEANKIITDALSFFTSTAHITVQHDLYASVHATAGNEAAIVCILGTGSNACYFDGNTVSGDDFSLGYILGDEGSGSYMGKLLLHDYFYGLLPEELHKAFHIKYNLLRNDVIEKVYRRERANEFLASFNIFIKENITHPYCTSLVHSSFSSFVQYFVLRFAESRQLRIHFTGSVAFTYIDILQAVMAEHKLQCGKVIASPMDDLLVYIKQNL